MCITIYFVKSSALGNFQTYDTPGDIREFTCRPCDKGYYTNEFDQLKCSHCERGKYTDEVKSPACKTCSWPSTTLKNGAESCDSLCICLESPYYYILMVVLLLMYLFALSYIEEWQLAKAVFFIMLQPILDVYSDLFYVLTTPFITEWMFYLAIFSFIFVNVVFLNRLISMGAYPGFFFTPPFDIKLSNSPLIILWVTFVTIPCQTYWFLAGIFLFQTKTLSIKNLWNLWFRRWTGTDKHAIYVKFNEELHNETLFAEFIYEQLPQIVVQSWNSALSGDFNSTAIFSVSLSIYSIMNRTHKFFYYTKFLGRTIAEIPAEIKLPFGIAEIKINQDKVTNTLIDISMYYSHHIYCAGLPSR